MNLINFEQRQNATEIDGIYLGYILIDGQEYEFEADFTTEYEPANYVGNECEYGSYDSDELTKISKLTKLDADGTEIEVTKEINDFLILNIII